MPAPNRFVTARLTFRQGATDEWSANNPILLASEPAWDTSVNMLKIGDGKTRWLDLDYVAKSGLMDSETIGGFVHDGSVIPSVFESITAGVVHSAAKLKAQELTAVDNFTAGLNGTVVQFAVIVTAGSNGSVSKLGAQTALQNATDKYDKDVVVTITATPDTGYVFNRWIGNGITDTSSAETTVTANDDIYARATFKLPS